MIKQEKWYKILLNFYNLQNFSGLYSIFHVLTVIFKGMILYVPYKIIPFLNNSILFLRRNSIIFASEIVQVHNAGHGTKLDQYIMNLFKTATFFIAGLSLSVSVLAADVEPVRITEEHKQRAKELVDRMTLEEKIDYIAGVRSFYLRSVERLGIPEIRMADGPVGVRNNTRSTLYPCGALTASTWNRELAFQLGHGLGLDSKARGVNIILGPGVNIYRAPMCGRSYEYFGEDPYLTGEIAKNYILGVQDEGVMATVKHFAANNQEFSRHNVGSDVDERTLQEIYFPAFRKAVQEAGVGAVMNSYNMLNSVHTSENAWLNIDILRDYWGFDGILMSDWTSVYSSILSANAGLDLECPKGVFFTREKLLPAVRNGLVSEDVIDLKVQHLLQTFIAFGFLDRPIGPDKSIPEDNPESRKIALDVAREGIVLLKNENTTLPMKKDRTLVLGPNADRITTGGGSGCVDPIVTVPVYQGLVSISSEKKVELLDDSRLYEDIFPDICTDDTFSTPGFRAEYYKELQFKGEPVHVGVDSTIDFKWKYGAPYEGMPDDKFSVLWTGVYKPEKDGTLRFEMAGDDGYRIIVDGEVLGGDWGNHSYTKRSAFCDVKAGQTYNIRYEYFDNAGEATVLLKAGIMNVDALKDALGKAENVVFCAGYDSSTEGEGFDRPFALPKDQIRLINQVAALHDRVTVVINAGGGVDFNGWSENVGAVLMAWYPGQEGGQAIAEVLAGKVNPSGKLPITIEERWEDNPVHDSYYPNIRDYRSADRMSQRVAYTEGIFVGYRGYDHLGRTPRYPFGFGMSYTTFEYSDIEVKTNEDETLTVGFTVKNTGKRDGAEVAQVYVHDVESSVLRPEKELKGFDKVFLKAGESKRVTVVLDRSAFAFYDIVSKDFKVEDGTFEILVGPSSADLPLKAIVDIM